VVRNPEVVLSRTLGSVHGNARLAEASVAEEGAAALDATDKDVAIGGAGLAGAAIELGLVDELRMSLSDRRRWRHAVPAAGR
jgi:dihydrofolate reductase